jgi:hypothetical protein
MVGAHTTLAYTW